MTASFFTGEKVLVSQLERRMRHEQEQGSGDVMRGLF